MMSSRRLNTLANRVSRMARVYFSNGSFRALGQLPRFVASRLLLRPVPANVSLALTYRCQCRYEHCCSGASDRDQHEELSTRELIERHGAEVAGSLG